MGTRNVIMVINKKGEIKVAQYGQWDGYPSGQGVVALEFLQKINLNKFQEKLENCKWVDEEKENELTDLGDKWEDIYPQLSRDHGAEILKFVNESKEDFYLQNSTDFATSSQAFSCEWCYVVNFQKGTFEVYINYPEIYDIYLLCDLPSTEDFKNSLDYYLEEGEDDYQENLVKDKARLSRICLFNRKKKLERIVEN